jgi:hypothetical protein
MIKDRYTEFLQVDSYCIFFLDFLYTHLCKRAGSTLLFFVENISIKSRPFIKIRGNLSLFLYYHTALYLWNESTRKQFDSVGATGISHLIILNTGSGF